MTTTTTKTTAPASALVEEVSLSAPDVAELAAEYVRLGAVVADAKERQDEIADQLRALDYGNHVAGNLTVALQHNRRPDSARIAEAYPQEQYPSIYKSALDLAAFKRYVAPVVVEQFQIEGPAKLIVKSA